MSKEAISKAPVRRVRRTPVGKRNVLTVSGKEAGYHYRIFNDVNDNIRERQEQGYEIVQASENISVGDSRLNQPSTVGSAVVMSVGQGTKGVLMRIRQDWYDEDQAAKQAHVSSTEEATKEKALDGNYGKLEIIRS